jgi:competence protein ComEA
MKKLMLLLGAWLLSTGLALAQVNINTATVEQLDSLKGIGPSKAKAIVDYRQKNGAFKSVDDLEKVPGIGPGILKSVRADVTISGVTRLPATASETAKPKAKTSDGAGKASSDKLPPAPAAPANPVTALKPASPAAPASPAVPSSSKVTAPAAPPAPSIAPPAKPAAPAKPAVPAAPASK